MKKRSKNVPLILVLLTTNALSALLIFLFFFWSNNRDVSGEWNTQLDMTEQAAVTAFIWLRDIEAVSVSLEDVESRMDGLTIQVDLVLERTGRSAGTFRCSIVPESYEDCNRNAYEAFAAVFRELIAERLRMAGYTGDTDEEAVEALAAETFGMPTVSYLMTCAPALLPPLEEMQGRYDSSGTYQTAGGILTREFEAGSAVFTKTERYIREKSDLILTEENGEGDPDGCPVIYRKSR